MNSNHAMCAGPEWAEHLQSEVLVPLVGPIELGERMLEIGPGPGAATEWLAPRVAELVAVEVDPQAAERLRARFAGSNVEVRSGDAARVDAPDASFDSVATFTTLHHLASTQAQDGVLREAFRVLRTGGVLVGSDSLASTGLHDFHCGDTYNPVEPAALLTRLRTVGFTHVMVAVADDVRFVARKLPECGET